MANFTHKIPAGTRVVVLVEVRGSQDSLVHASGAVGVVSRTPSGRERSYLVRLPDGFEISLLRDEFDPLNEFKDRPGKAGPGASLPRADYVWEDFVILRCVTGSRAYHLDVDDSDTDLRGIYVAPSELQCSLFGPPEQLEDSATQSLIWELQKFLKMALKANPNTLECLYTPLVEKLTKLGEELLLLRKGFLTKMIFQTYSGYAITQFKNLEQNRRVRGVVRWKHAAHLLRLLLAGTEVLRQGYLPVQIDEHRERLLAVRRGEVPWDEFDAWRRNLHEEFGRAHNTSRLPEGPDYESANRFLLRARSERFRRLLFPGTGT